MNLGATFIVDASKPWKSEIKIKGCSHNVRLAAKEVKKGPQCMPPHIKGWVTP